MAKDIEMFNLEFLQNFSNHLYFFNDVTHNPRYFFLKKMPYSFHQTDES